MSGLEGLEKAFRRILTSISSERSRFEQVQPAEYKTIYELLAMNRPSIRLASGELHRISTTELQKMRMMLPWYMHRLVKVPFVFTYKRGIWESKFVLLNPDRWGARALNFILHGSLRDKRAFNIEEFEKLVRLFKSLIFIVIEVELT